MGSLPFAAARVPMFQVTVLPPPVLALPAPPSGLALTKVTESGCGIVTVTPFLAAFV